jgi:hypothetical protein
MNVLPADSPADGWSCFPLRGISCSWAQPHFWRRAEATSPKNALGGKAQHSGAADFALADGPFHRTGPDPV